jgi:hypothetical protein
MKKTIFFIWLSLVAPISIFSEKNAMELCDSPILIFDAQKESLTKEVVIQGVETRLNNEWLEVTTGFENPWPGVQLSGNWNLKNHTEIELVIANYDDTFVKLNCRFDSPRPGDDMKNTVSFTTSLAPDEIKTWKIRLPSIPPEKLKDKLFAMRGTPFGANYSFNSTFDPQEVTRLIVFVAQSNRVQHWGVKQIIAKSPALLSTPVSEDSFFPMIDKYGQYMHADWPGKIHNDADLQKVYLEEQIDLEAHPSPQDRNQYGGWSAVPKREATGHFRVEKIDGKWWFIDPEGCLFWSHGTNCVIVSNAVTPITDREFYFAELPSRKEEFASCYSTGNWAPHNYYEGKGGYDLFDFSKANIIRKHGVDWQNSYGNLIHQRLRSWGMNTIANWSEPQFYRMQRTPYTDQLYLRASPIQASGGYWGKFSDPFDPEFRTSIHHSAEKAAQTSGNDPWCIGYFVDNEQSWGDEISLAIAALQSPADQPAKKAVVNYLKDKYLSIEHLNKVWQTAYASWESLLQSVSPPEETNIRNDLVECYQLIADRYFRTIKEELNKACPNKLYLGCRFAWGNDEATKIAAKYCDVISFNKYEYDLHDFKLPEGIDKPCIIGEFHFGALDRGMFHTGLCPVSSQKERAETYEYYVTSALMNPCLIGTHWFQYMDQATTGRGDGENYQIGLLTACDSPYPETITAVRKVGEKMYELRYHSIY